MKFFIYIFGKAYYFCINVLDGDEFPHFWATGFTVFLIMTNIYVVLSIYVYYYDNIYISLIRRYFNYLDLIIIILVCAYLSYRKKYPQILNAYAQIPKSYLLPFRILSIIYYIITFASMFYMTNLIRAKNLGYVSNSLW